MATDHAHLIKLATRNNAAWCDAVCRAHGTAGRFFEDLWFNDGEVPIYYPNIVTLLPGLDQGQVSELIDDERPTFSIKDSYSELDFSKYGLTKLFEAEWLLAPHIANIVGNMSTRIVTDAEELAKWARAWGKGEQIGLFTPTLLTDNRIRFIAIYEDDTIVAGGIVFASNDIAGLSNVFFNVERAEECWHGCVMAIQITFPGLPIIDYEHGDELVTAKLIGFETLGPLSVWAKT